jgi:hypothetical protein
VQLVTAGCWQRRPSCVRALAPLEEGPGCGKAKGKGGHHHDALAARAQLVTAQAQVCWHA